MEQVPKRIRLTIVTLNGQTMELIAEETATVHHVKRALESVYGIKMDSQDLIYWNPANPEQPKMLHDEKLLVRYGMADCAKLQIVPRPKTGRDIRPTAKFFVQSPEVDKMIDRILSEKGQVRDPSKQYYLLSFKPGVYEVRARELPPPIPSTLIESYSQPNTRELTEQEKGVNSTTSEKMQKYQAKALIKKMQKTPPTPESTTTLQFGDLSVLYEKALPLAPMTTPEKGDFTILECSVDLCHHLSSNRSDLDGKTVIELGCGAGLPGIAALKQGARHVCFQDRTDDLNNMWTRRNVQLNFDLSSDGRCSFLFGDWDRVRSKCVNTSTRFDIVLASETICNVDHCEKMIRTIDAIMVSSGFALLAVKSSDVDSIVYFLKNDGTFEVQCVWSSSDTSIARQILKLTKRKPVS